MESHRLNQIYGFSVFMFIFEKNTEFKGIMLKEK